jgi:hypothetical protein
VYAEFVRHMLQDLQAQLLVVECAYRCKIKLLLLLHAARQTVRRTCLG